MGIIDILQEWNFHKRLERFFKVYFRFQDKNGLSAVAPDFYAQRFWKRCVMDVFEGLEAVEPELDPSSNSVTNNQGSSVRRMLSSRGLSMFEYDP